jgi:Thioredoxin
MKKLSLILLTGSMFSAYASVIDNLDQFEAAIADSIDPVCTIFTADWCSICRDIRDPLDTIVTNPDIASKIHFIHVPFDAGTEICKKYHISAVPAFCFFRTNKNHTTQIGLKKGVADFNKEFLELLNSKLLHSPTLAWHQTWKRRLPSVEETKGWFALTIKETKNWVALSIKNQLITVRNGIDTVIKRYFY